MAKEAASFELVVSDRGLAMILMDSAWAEARNSMARASPSAYDTRESKNICI